MKCLQLPKQPLPVIRTFGSVLVAAIVAVGLLGCAQSPPPAAMRLDDVLEKSSVTIYPALVWTGRPGYDHGSAQSLVPFIKERTSGAVSVSAEEIPAVNSRWGEARARSRIVGDAAGLHLRDHPLRTDFGLWPVYVFVPGTSSVQEVHVILFDPQGKVIRQLSVAEFTEPPQSVADCTNLVMESVRRREAIYGSRQRP